MNFQRARTAEQTADRQKEIICAAKDLYARHGFEGVTFKAISERTSFSRPTIYNYYEAKEDVLLDVLKGEYLDWHGALREWAADGSPRTGADLCGFLSESLRGRELFLRLLSTDYTAVETGCAEKKLAEYKAAIQPVFADFRAIVDRTFPTADDGSRDLFCLLFFSLLGGLYAQLSLSEKQLRALHIANPAVVIPDYHDTLRRALTTLCAGME